MIILSPPAVAPLQLQPLTRDQAFAFVRRHHRHHGPPVGHKFSIGVQRAGELVGVIVIGRPVARHLDDGYTVEATRCCTDGARNAASKLYAAGWRAARAMGYRRFVTYTLAHETGESLRAAGLRVVAEIRGRSWDTPTRRRLDKHPTSDKHRWEIVA
jgi:hypothetical protein